MSPVKRSARTGAAPKVRLKATGDTKVGPGPTDYDIFLFNEGTHTRLYERLGAHPYGRGASGGTHFSVWAPNAERVSVMGSFNDWDPAASPLVPRGTSGIFEGSVRGAGPGALYKYRLVGRDHGALLDKADPMGFLQETPPGTASQIWDLTYKWRDRDWMSGRASRTALDAPVSIYEVHVGSWRRVPEEGHRSLTYREMAPYLVDHVKDMGFTHVEFLPLTEHPFYGSWGYEPTAYFAPTSRYGTPQDLMFLVDELHRAGVGTILDWVPSHFPADAHGLGLFDGTHLYEHADPKRGWHPEWKTYIFNYGRLEVRSFLASSAAFWLDRYHFDALRVDGVASMLYLDYSRGPGEWVPNEHGGRENEEAIRLLRWVNEVCYRDHPGVQTIAEESTAWPMVSRPTTMGGLGFGYKWDMGWMHDTLEYFAREPVHRRFHQDRLTFRMVYAFQENFVLPLSHDEVVYGKGSLLGHMPGDAWQKRANLRALLGYQYTLPGKKLLFMGGEFGQEREWNHDESLDWHLREVPEHEGILRWVRALNKTYRGSSALYRHDHEPAGFEWIDASDADQSVLSYMRKGDPQDPPVLVVLNLTPVPRRGYRVGSPLAGAWTSLANSDDAPYGGTGDFPTPSAIDTEPVPMHGRESSLLLDLPPLSILILQGGARPKGTA